MPQRLGTLVTEREGEATRTMLTPNAQRLLRALIRNGPMYRADLARTLDVSRATVTNLAQTLSSEGLIHEPDHEPTALKNLIGTTPRLGTLASVMFSVDACTATLATLDGRVLGTQTLALERDDTAGTLLAAGADLVDTILATHNLSARSLCALHLAVDTQMDAQSGEIYAHRASSKWFGVNPKKYFASRFSVPVHVQNSARLEALAEHLWGVGRDHSNVLHVEISWGITSGHIVNGVIQSGARGGSGELGHTIYDWNGPVCTCGNSGCLMQYASIPAILRDYKTAHGSDVGWAEFCALAKNGDADAAAITHRAASVLGRMLVNTSHILDPEIIVLGGEASRNIPDFVDDVATVVRRLALPLVGRNVQVHAANLIDAPAATSRAGIESLRALDEVASAALLG